MRTVMVCLVILLVCFAYKSVFVNPPAAEPTVTPVVAPPRVVVAPIQNAAHQDALSAPANKSHKSLDDLSNSLTPQGATNGLDAPADKNHASMDDLR